MSDFKVTANNCIVYDIQQVKKSSNIPQCYVTLYEFNHFSQLYISFFQTKNQSLKIKSQIESREVGAGLNYNFINYQ